ncbi:MAG: hypothetical protein WBW74_11985 [Xanthobacteraceae bacterium]
MSDPKANETLGRAILSLLVAADQRCPAIIGQAHLLWHGQPGTTPQDLTNTFKQLKREADDLSKAIAEVDAAIKTYGVDGD